MITHLDRPFVDGLFEFPGWSEHTVKVPISRIELNHNLGCKVSANACSASLGGHALDGQKRCFGSGLE
jgi:hypothetical protein